jgi:hypothetical protein
MTKLIKENLNDSININCEEMKNQMKFVTRVYEKNKNGYHLNKQ